jgi:hypothetical protein
MTSFENTKQLQKYIKKNREKYNSMVKPYLKDLEEEKIKANFESMSEEEKTLFVNQIEEYNRIIKQESLGWLI